VITAYFSQGFYQFDEHTQVMEFGAYKLGMTEEKNLSWEFASRMRPAIQPAMVYAAHKFMGFFGVESPFIIAFLLRLFSAALSFLSIHLLIHAFYDKIQGEKLRLAFVALSFLLWFLVFNSVRFSSENMAGRIFTIAFALFFIWKNLNGKHYFLMGVILGLSFLFRYQNAFLMVGWLAWLLFIHKSKFSHLLLTASGILLMFAMGVVIDKWFYGEWVLSTWKYFEENILLDKMSGFGVDPWYYYIVQIFNIGIPPFSLLYILPFVLLMVYRPKDSLVWTILPFLLIHFYIAHKELRFLYPAIGLLPLVIVKAGEIINEKWPTFFQNKIIKLLTILFWIQNGIFTLIVALKSADAQVDLYNEIYSKYETPVVVYYTKDNPYTRAMDVYYYKRTNLSTRKIDKIEDVKMLSDTIILVATVQKEEDEKLQRNNDKIYSAMPDWLKMFNVFNWVERTRFWKVYEIKNPIVQ
ncbi:MAG: hypothetical protein ACO3E1_12250, partial [Flavobacteriales bacterium]